MWWRRSRRSDLVVVARRPLIRVLIAIGAALTALAGALGGVRLVQGRRAAANPPPLVTGPPEGPEDASEEPENERGIYQGQREHELELNRATAAHEHAIVSPLFLLNGGAVVAFLTLLGTAAKRSRRSAWT